LNNFFKVNTTPIIDASLTNRTGRDLTKAKNWIAKAIEMDEGKYWMYRQQALILHALNETEAAISASKTSLKLATTAGNQDYIRLNEQSIKEWSK